MRRLCRNESRHPWIRLGAGSGRAWYLCVARTDAGRRSKRKGSLASPSSPLPEPASRQPDDWTLGVRSGSSPQAGQSARPSAVSRRTSRVTLAGPLYVARPRVSLSDVRALVRLVLGRVMQGTIDCPRSSRPCPDRAPVPGSRRSGVCQRRPAPSGIRRPRKRYGDPTSFTAR